MRERILSFLAVALAAAALSLAALGNASQGSAYWVTTKPVAAGARLSRSDLEQVRVSGAVVRKAIPASHPFPIGRLARNLPAGTLIVPSDFGSSPVARQPTRVEVPIPVGTGGPGLARGTTAVIASFGGDQPPQVISRQAPVVSVSAAGGEPTVTVALPLVEAEEVLAALGSAKVAVLPWQP